MQSWSQREAHISSVIAYAETHLPREDQGLVTDFIRKALGRAAPEDIVARSVETLFAICVSLWKFATRSPSDVPKLRIFNPTSDEHGWQSPHTVIQICNDDMPFLVSSITGQLGLMGIDIHLNLHPVIESHPNTNRAPRLSVIHLEVDRKTAQPVLREISEKLTAVLSDVRAAVQDWSAMTDALERAADRQESETKAFLQWLKDNHFTFLGYRRYSHVPKEAVVEESLGILRDHNRHVFRRGPDTVAISDEIQEFLNSDHPVMVTKANVKSTVHRPVHLDYIGVRHRDSSGKTIGEHRFVGLFSSTAYRERCEVIPLLRQKVARVFEQAGFSRLSHNGKTVLHILESFPRDELFQVDDDTLFRTVMGILFLMERPHTKAFLREDPHGRYVSALVYVPRDSYESNLRTKVEQILCTAYDGHISARHTQLTDDAIARWHFIIRTKPGTPKPSVDEINAQIALAARGWRDQLKEALIARHSEEKGIELYDQYATAFPLAYQDSFPAEKGALDIEKLELSRSSGTQFNFYRLAQDPDHSLRLKIYHPSAVIPLSEVMPLLENLGLIVIEEDAYDVIVGPQSGCIHDFVLTHPKNQDIDLSDVKRPLEEALLTITQGGAENDGFNSLILGAGLTWRKVVIIRAYARYLRQLGLSFSEDYLRQTLADNPAIARNLVALFEARFDPAVTEHEEKTAALSDKITALLEQVTSLDQDRILRAFRGAIHETQRTNYYQTHDGKFRPGLALKINTRDLKEAPLPKPYSEIFVYSPQVEGVHLRYGPVARGGLRWSDRPEDFRTEVLGLVKAQHVKNAVIVPAGAKGGFYPKHPPKTGGRDAIFADAIASYQTFIGSLLDVTDNRIGENIIPPEAVLCHDGPDPYLVVAADKGTASFSDYANAIAETRGFWLGDAFASGGSNGYDHKAMGITARGAWISVSRHFRELGIDLNSQSISVVGIGDMSGDVFGNGMLLSDKIMLKAAFDHRNIFIDPSPDPATSHAERRRLFDLPRSSWADYNPKLLSKGGIVIDRKAKSVTLSPEAQAILGVGPEPLAPNDIIQLVLKAEVDLLWIGGIGTYIKGASESNRDVGDRANDPVRINGEDLRCKVVGEGGNLGCTQQGRIAFALAGGAINTDSVDNSAGVNCSDHEVNIKILLNGLEQAGKITRPERDALLAEMTDEVAALVLRHNYLQTLSVTLASVQAQSGQGRFQRLMAALEKAVGLDRSIEGLPTDEALNDRKATGQSLTRPEIAILISYAKMAAKLAITQSPLAHHPYLVRDLASAFPSHLQERFGSAIEQHRLRAEIVATVLANEMINRLGPNSLQTIAEQVDCDLDHVAAAYVIVREIYDLPSLWTQIDALDGKVPADIQIQMYLNIANFTHDFVTWLLQHLPEGEDIESAIKRLDPGVRDMIAAPYEILDHVQMDRITETSELYENAGVPHDLALRLSALEVHATTGDIVELARTLNRPVEDVARAYYYLGHKVGYTWLRAQAENMSTNDHWERLGLIAIVDDILDQQRNLTERALSDIEQDAIQAIEAWIASNSSNLSRAATMLTELRNSPPAPIKLGYAARHLRSLLVK